MSSLGKGAITTQVGVINMECIRMKTTNDIETFLRNGIHLDIRQFGLRETLCCTRGSGGDQATVSEL